MDCGILAAGVENAGLGSGPRLEPGNWYLQVDAGGWRLTARLPASDAPQRVYLVNTDPRAQ